MSSDLSKPALFALGVACLLALLGLGFLARDLALRLAASPTLASLIGIATSFAFAMVLKAIIWRLGTWRGNDDRP